MKKSFAESTEEDKGKHKEKQGGKDRQLNEEDLFLICQFVELYVFVNISMPKHLRRILKFYFKHMKVFTQLNEMRLS